MLRKIIGLIYGGIEVQTLINERVPNAILGEFDFLSTLPEKQKAIEILDIISCSPIEEHSLKLLELGIIKKLLPLFTEEHPELQEVVLLPLL